MDKKQMAEDDYKVIISCWKLLKQCLDHLPIGDNQKVWDGVCDEIIKIGESNNGKWNERFTRKMALLVIDEIENADKCFEEVEK